MNGAFLVCSSQAACKTFVVAVAARRNAVLISVDNAGFESMIPKLRQDVLNAV